MLYLITSPADLKLVLQQILILQNHSWTLSEDFCDLLGGKQALLSEKLHSIFHRFHRNSQDFWEVDYHPLKTTYDFI